MNWAFLTQLVDRWFVLRIKRVSDADVVVFLHSCAFPSHDRPHSV